MRKANLARLLAGRSDGILIAPYEQGEIGPELFQKACEFGYEGLVSKHCQRAYRAGRVSVLDQDKKSDHPAMKRVKEAHRK
jgi:bifunctional non-homologous end joining protein LigD